MTNDYMFRAVLQESNVALRGLICSLLQLANRLNWQNRSVMYLCRSYDRLNRGQEYQDAKPAIHIGFLDYTLFSKFPEFYAAYKLINIKNHQVYNDNLTLYVADLSRIDLATEEDKQYHIDSWAKLFKATTWEELKMIASEDDALYEAAKTLFYKSSDEEIRMHCLDREEYYADLRSYERAIAEKENELERSRLEHEQELELGRIEHEQELERSREYYESQIRQLRAEIAQLKKQQ